LTTGALSLWCGWEKAIHDAVHHAALHVDHIHIASGILTERADLDRLEAKLDALPTLVGPTAQGKDAARAQVAKYIATDERRRGRTSIHETAHDRTVHVVAVGDQ